MNETKNTNHQIVENGAAHEPFFIVPSKVFEYGLNPYELSVLFYLLMRADNKTHACYPSVSSIVKDCKMSDSKARTSIHSLEEKGIIAIKRQYVSTRKGFNRQASNYYTISLFEDELPPIPQTVPHRIINSPPIHDIQVPPVPQTGEINKTKPNRTKTNITISTELSMAEAETVMKERNDFLDLKRDCFEKLKNDFKIEEDYVLLLDRALEHLWSKKEMEYEAHKYSASEVKSLLTEKLGASSLASCVEYLRHSGASVRSPVPYLAKCILGALTQGKTDLPSATAGRENESGNKNMSAFGEAKNSSSFDVDDFFQAALERSYKIMSSDLSGC